MNPIEALIKGILGLFGIYNDLPIRTPASIGRQPGRAPVGRGVFKVHVHPLRYKITYTKSQWQESAKLLDLFKSGDLISYADGIEFQKGFQFPAVPAAKPKLWTIPLASWPALLVLMQTGKNWQTPLAAVGKVVQGGSKVYGEKDGFTLSVASPGPDKTIIMEPRTTWSKTIGTLTGFWRMTKSGPRALSGGEAMDQINQHS